MKPVIVLCEYSGVVRDAFIAQGVEAHSCDLLPSEAPGKHFQQDLFSVDLSGYGLVISFPPCTDLSVSGARWFEKKRLSGEQEASVNFFLDVWKLSNCTENPIGIMNRPDYLKKWFPHLHRKAVNIGFPFRPSQIVQPWMFGHPESKATCFWLRGLPPLIPTNILSKPKSGHWENQTHSGQNKLPPSEDRWKIRSKTYQGIADAMAYQWKDFVKK